MSLKSFRYYEFKDQPQFWELEKCDLVGTNLIVGRNATGKSRLINVIEGMCKVICGTHTKPFTSGYYEAEIVLSGKVFSLCLEFLNGQVNKETLDVDGVRRLTRGPDGKGQIFYEQQNTSIDFQVPPSAIVIQQRQDELQHSFVAELTRWARGSQTFRFGSSFGQDRLVALGSLESLIAQQEQSSDTVDLTSAYSKAFTNYGEPLDAAILRDMKDLGYDLKDVGSTDMRLHHPGLNMPEPLIGMFVIESGRETPLPQMQMSQGMYRALALIIHVNIAAFSKLRTLVLIDDIGEGLDFERSTGLINILIRHAKESGLQLVMTSNDRFVMNTVPLEYWSLLRRDGSIVRSYNERNSAKEFGEFKYMGLSNFDFFTSASFQ